MEKQSLFNYTGGIHAAALFDATPNLILLKEDVGRHNALDKLTGHALKHLLMPLSNYVLLLSGRISFELMQKAISSGIFIIAAFGAPTNLAVELALKHGVTLIGFLKKDSYNIYSCPERLIV